MEKVLIIRSLLLEIKKKIVEKKNIFFYEKDQKRIQLSS